MAGFFTIKFHDQDIMCCYNLFYMQTFEVACQIACFALSNSSEMVANDVNAGNVASLDKKINN